MGGKASTARHSKKPRRIRLTKRANHVAWPQPFGHSKTIRFWRPRTVFLFSPQRAWPDGLPLSGDPRVFLCPCQPIGSRFGFVLNTTVDHRVVHPRGRTRAAG